MMILLSILWVILPAVFYLIVYFFKSDELEQNKLKWMNATLIGLYTLSQFVFFIRGFSKGSFVYAPDYLTFTDSFIVLPAILAVLTWVLLQAVQQKEWGSVMKFSYYTIVNILALTFLFGPFLL
jgi:ACR3 family arsenite efflux pump ArsB